MNILKIQIESAILSFFAFLIEVKREIRIEIKNTGLY